MNPYVILSDGVSAGVSELKENVDDVYHQDFGIGPAKISIKDIFGKAYKYLEPPNSTISNDENVGSQTVSIIAESNSAFGQENFVSMFDRLDGSLFDGSINNIQTFLIALLSICISNFIPKKNIVQQTIENNIILLNMFRMIVLIWMSYISYNLGNSFYKKTK